MLVLSLLLLLLVAASVALFARAVVLPRLRTAERVRGIEAYGFHAAPVVVPETAEGPKLGALASALGAALAPRFKGMQTDELRRELLAAGLYRVTPQALLGYRVIGLVVMTFLGFVLFSSRGAAIFVLGMGICMALGWMGPLTLVRRRATERLAQIDRSLPDLIDLLVVTIEAGMGLGASLQLATGRLGGPLADELRLTMHEQRMGRSLNDALLTMLGRADTPGLRSFVRSITQGETLGVAIGTIMRNLSIEMRKRRRSAAEEQAQKAPVKMLFPLVFLILPALLVVILGPALFTIADTLGG
jgi:tight adherence protein C